MAGPVPYGPADAGLTVLEGVAARIPWLLARAGIGVAILDEDLRVLCVNGVGPVTASPVDQPGRTVSGDLAGIPGSFRDRLARCLTGGAPLEGYELSGVGGTPPDPDSWRVDAMPVTLAPGRQGLAVVFTDTTGQRRAERRLRQIIDSLFVFVGLCRPDGTLIEANEAALKAGGLTAHDVLGKPFWEAYWWNYDVAVQDQLRAAIARAARGLPSQYDVVVRLAGDQRITIDFQLIPVIENGEVVALVPSGLDVTDRLLDSQRLAALAGLSAELNGLLEAEQITSRLLRRGPDVVGCDFLNIAIVDLDAQVLRIRRPADVQGTAPAAWTTLPMSRAGTPFHDAIATESLIWVHDTVERHRKYPDTADTADSLGVITSVAVPLVVAGQTLGVIGVGWQSPVEVTDMLTARLALVADICGQALWRAMRSESSVALVRHLTEQLLGQEDDVDGLDIACGYLPALASLNVGGDWYDVIRLDDSHVGVVVGDVVGHGVQAAAQMAVTKSTVRALLAADPSLATFIPRLARAHGVTGEFVATAQVAVIDIASHVVDLLSLGHHPAILTGPAGDVRLIPGRHDAPVGLANTAAHPIRYPFPPGSLLILYTDGLTEVRGADPDESTDRLLVHLEALPPKPTAQQVRDHLLHTVTGPRRDDVALIVVRTPR